MPAYAQSLEALMGEGALARLLELVAEHEQPMTGMARLLFARWLEHVVGLRPPARHEAGQLSSSALSSR